MNKLLIIIRETIVFLLLSTSAPAWSDLGHQVVARIAWEYMAPQVRAKVITLLMAAPPDADLSSLFPNDARPLWLREQEFFLRASTWADRIRHGEFPDRRDKYHKSLWHFINFFWEQPTPKASPSDRTDLMPAPENVVERLRHFQSFISDTTQDRSQRAIAFAWVLHLVGDIHQPLHCSARVTCAKRSVYPSSLRRYEMPSKKYRKNVYRVAEPAIALAGYRLAEMLNRLFAS